MQRSHVTWRGSRAVGTQGALQAPPTTLSLSWAPAVKMYQMQSSYERAKHLFSFSQ